MYSSNSNRSGAAAARVFMALFAIMLTMALGLLASPAAAAPFAYVANEGDGTVSVINTATNTVVGIPIPVGREPSGGRRHAGRETRLCRELGAPKMFRRRPSTNMVVATVAVGNVPFTVAITPNGKHAYVANIYSNIVSVIDTATDTMEPTIIMVGNTPS